MFVYQLHVSLIYIYIRLYSHDVDHVGVSNAQLVKEGVPIAEKYQRSVAEQNSLDISWDLLMRPEYQTLRTYLFPADHTEDLKRFRQLVVNVRSCCCFYNVVVFERLLTVCDDVHPLVVVRHTERERENHNVSNLSLFTVRTLYYSR